MSDSIVAAGTSSPKDINHIIAATHIFVREYMSQFDASHDYAHIQRVLEIARRITAAEEAAAPSNTSAAVLDHDIITLGCLLHDVGDMKYLKPGEDGTIMAHDFLLEQGASVALADAVQTIVNHVSFTAERKDPQLIQGVLARHPELVIVQDADRLDALGAVGIGRCFIYNVLNGAGRGKLDYAVTVMEERLVPRQALMKTVEGKRLAEERTERIRSFMRWWKEEMEFAGGSGIDA